MTESNWNSLEVVNLIVAGLTPVLVAILAFYFNHILKKFEKAQWTNQKIIEKRISIYDIIVPKLNDLLCYYCYIGSWRSLTPKEIIETKRFLDKHVYVYAPLFSEEMLNRYNAFVDTYFEKFTGWGVCLQNNVNFSNQKIRDTFSSITNL